MSTTTTEEVACTGPCGRTLDWTLEQFPRRGDGLKRQCKQCENAKRVARNHDPEGVEARRLEREAERTAPMKTCARPDCGKTYPRTAEHFHQNSNRHDGLSPYCVYCQRANVRSYAERNPEKVAEKNREWSSRPEVRERKAEQRRKRLLVNNPTTRRNAIKASIFGPLENVAKRCANCGHGRDDSLFADHSGMGDGLSAWCTFCMREWSGRHRAIAEGNQVDDDVDYGLIFNNANGCCEECGIAVRLGESGPVDAPEGSFDHVVPIVNGGAHSRANVRLLCGRSRRDPGTCHGRKSAAEHRASRGISRNLDTE